MVIVRLWIPGLTCMSSETSEEYTPLQTPLLAHDKLMSFTVSTTECILRETKQVRSSHFWQAKWRSPLGLKYCIYKSRSPYEHYWRSLRKDFLTQRLNKCLNVSCLQGRELLQSHCSRTGTTWRTLHISSSSAISNILWQLDFLFQAEEKTFYSFIFTKLHVYTYI